jgi:hypothetical protein
MAAAIGAKGGFTMLKYLSIFTALMVVGPGVGNAQQREADIHRIEVPSATFDIVLAIAKPTGGTADYRNQPDPNIVYLRDDLVAGYTTKLAELLDIDTLMRPACSFMAGHVDKSGRTPVIVYIVAKSPS